MAQSYVVVQMSDALRRILVVDDDVQICALLKVILGRLSFAVDTCGDAEGALVQLRNDGPYALLITDFMLPGMSGIELIAQVRSASKTAGLPILMISGHRAYPMDERAEAAGADRFVSKPFKADDILEAVGTLVGDRSTDANEE
jgi:DNA-binding response OmpR family regulator